MPTLVRDPQPAGFEALLERRRRLGQDVFDEVWQGVYHMNPAPSGRHADDAQQLAELPGALAREAGLVPTMSIFNLGEPHDYRVPDGGMHRERSDRVYYPTAALVEIVSAGDEKWEKVSFYAAHHVDELLIVDPQEREARWTRLTAGGEYDRVERSELIEVSAAELTSRLDWPE